MNVLKCSDMGMKCSFVAAGKTKEEAKKKLFEHAAKKHSEMISNMSSKDRVAMERKMDKLLE